MEVFSLVSMENLDTIQHKKCESKNEVSTVEQVLDMPARTAARTLAQMGATPDVVYFMAVGAICTAYVNAALSAEHDGHVSSGSVAFLGLSQVVFIALTVVAAKLVELIGQGKQPFYTIFEQGSDVMLMVVLLLTYELTFDPFHESSLTSMATTAVCLAMYFSSWENMHIREFSTSSKRLMTKSFVAAFTLAASFMTEHAREHLNFFGEESHAAMGAVAILASLVSITQVLLRVCSNNKMVVNWMALFPALVHAFAGWFLLSSTVGHRFPMWCSTATVLGFAIINSYAIIAGVSGSASDVPVVYRFQSAIIMVGLAAHIFGDFLIPGCLMTLVCWQYLFINAVFSGVAAQFQFSVVFGFLISFVATATVAHKAPHLAPTPFVALVAWHAIFLVVAGVGTSTAVSKMAQGGDMSKVRGASNKKAELCM